MVFDGGFRVREADAETDGKCHRRQAREGAAGAGRTEVGAGDKGLSGSGTAVTKHICPYNLDAGVGESVGFVERSECGAEQITQSRHWARSGQLCPPSEDLEDLEQSGKAFKSGEEKAGSIKLIGRADTLPTEGFYD